MFFIILIYIYKPNFVSYKSKTTGIYLGYELLHNSSDSSFDKSKDTVLHTRKDLAVSLLVLL